MVKEVEEVDEEASRAAYASYCHLARWYLVLTWILSFLSLPPPNAFLTIFGERLIALLLSIGIGEGRGVRVFIYVCVCMCMCACVLRATKTNQATNQKGLAVDGIDIFISKDSKMAKRCHVYLKLEYWW